MESEKYRVLLVEDNPGDARLVNEFLSEDTFESFELYQVATLAEALDYLVENKPEVVLLDLGLPDSGGIQTLDAIYQQNQQLAIVVLTGMDQESLGLEAVREGAQDYIPKSAIDGRLLLRALHFAIQRKANESRMRELLRHDLLTELPNRRALMEELTHRLNADSPNISIGILFVNLDQFRLLNENLGNHVADAALKAVGERLTSSLKEQDFVARVERDEFVALLQLNTTTIASRLTSVAERVLDELSKPLEFTVAQETDVVVNLTASIGVASYTERDSVARSADRLIGNAETAMNKAKSSGGNCCHYFDDQLNIEAQSRVRIAFGLKNALKNKEFHLFYQPILDVENNGIFGFECLLRWKPDSGENVRPDEFIPILEESFQIVAVGEWVMEQACADYRRWVDQNLIDSETRVFINFSPRQFVDANLLKHTLALNEKYQIPTGVLHYEITENLMLNSADFVLDQLDELQRLGVCIAIDDFGSGFSSMSYLKDMPCDYLKIDKSFIQTLTESERNSVITSAIIRLGNSLGIGVIGEGIETEEIETTLAELGCQYQQGFYRAKPMNGHDFENWLGKLAENRPS